jgi:serine/threonine protein kinase
MPRSDDRSMTLSSNLFGMHSLRPEDPPAVGPYRPIAELGAGAMGRVLLAEGPDGELVAVKLVAPHLLHDGTLRSRIGGEVLPARESLTGPRTAPVVAAGEQAGAPWLASEFVPGPTLAEALAHQGPLGEAAVLRLARDLAAALAGVREAGLVHRDVKPSNIVLTEDGARLIDFSLACAGGGSYAAAAQGCVFVVVGTPSYSAPEQIRGGASTPASDVFALGAVLCAAATGASPFAAADLLKTMHNVAESEPDLTGVPERLRDVIGQCLRKDLAARPDPAALLQLLHGIEDGPESWPEGVQDLIRRQRDEIAVPRSERVATPWPPSAPALPPPGAVKPWRSRILSPVPIVAAFAVLVLLAVAGGIALHRGGEAGNTESEGAVEELEYPAEPRVYEERPFTSLTTVGELRPYPYAERAHGQELEIYDGIGYYYYRSNPNPEVPTQTYTGAMDMQTGELLWEKEEATPEEGVWDARWVFGEDLLVLWVMVGDFASEFRFLDPASGEELAVVPAGTSEPLDDFGSATYESPGWFVVSGRLVWVKPDEPDTVYIYDGTGQVEHALTFDRDVVRLGVFTDWDAYLAEPEGDISDGRIWMVTEDAQVTAFDVATGASEAFAEVEGYEPGWYWDEVLVLGFQSRLLVITDDWESLEMTVYEGEGAAGVAATAESGPTIEMTLCGEFRVCVADLDRLLVFDLVEGEFVYDSGEDWLDFLMDARGVGGSILVTVMDENVDFQTVVLDQQLQPVETLPGRFFPIDEGTALQTASSSYGQIELNSGPVTGLAPQGGETTVLEAEMEVGGLCDFDAETMICFLMEGLQAYRFR